MLSWASTLPLALLTSRFNGRRLWFLVVSDTLIRPAFVIALNLCIRLASPLVMKRDGFRLCLYFVRANAGYTLELVQTLDVAILFPVRDDRLCFFLCQT